MTEKEIKKLGKAETVALITAKDNEINALRLQVQQLQRQISDNMPETRSIGSIAQEALAVNGIFTAAQKAADEYLSAVMNMNDSAEKHCSEMIEQTKAHCERMLADTKHKCVSMETDAKNRSAEIICEAQDKARTALYSVTSALRDYYLRHEDKLRDLPADLQRLIRSPR